MKRSVFIRNKLKRKHILVFEIGAVVKLGGIYLKDKKYTNTRGKIVNDLRSGPKQYWQVEWEKCLTLDGNNFSGEKEENLILIEK